MKRQTSDTFNDNEWCNERERMTKNVNELQLVVQRVATTGTTSDNQRYNEWQQIKTGHSDLGWVRSSKRQWL